MPASPSAAPTRAVDTHAHVFVRGLPLADARRYAPDYDATLDDYLALLDAHGLSHGVLVQPSFLGTDNSFLAQALAAAPERLRGVAVVAPGVAQEDLAALDAAGVRGMRLNLVGLPTPELRAPGWQDLFERANALSWHVEVHAPSSRLPGILPALLDAGCRVVVDHFGRPDASPDGEAGLRRLLELAGGGRIWVKLSAPYRNWPDGEIATAGRDAARVLLDACGPERLLWGSDWPHTEHRDRASYAASRSWLDDWLPDEAARRIVLAETPRALFRFQ